MKIFQEIITFTLIPTKAFKQIEGEKLLVVRTQKTRNFQGL